MQQQPPEFQVDTVFCGERVGEERLRDRRGKGRGEREREEEKEMDG